MPGANKVDRQRNLTACLYVRGEPVAPYEFAIESITRDGEDWRQRTSSQGSGMPFCEFPDVLGADVNFFRPNDGSITNEGLIEERWVVQPLSVRLVEIARAVKDAFFPVVEFNVEFVASQWLHRNYIVNDLHFSAGVQS